MANGVGPTGIFQHDRDNKHVLGTHADCRGQRSGSPHPQFAGDPPGRPSKLAPTGDPFDRAHCIRAQGTKLLRAAAYVREGTRCRNRADIWAEPRLYLRSEMRPVRMCIEGEERTVLVGLDSFEESIADRAGEIRKATGVNLLGGSMAAAVEAALNRGGGRALARKSRQIEERE